ncbi:MAG: hypothetical protein ACUVRV_00185 [Cyanobacteriota bacterium]
MLQDALQLSGDGLAFFAHTGLFPNPPTLMASITVVGGVGPFQLLVNKPQQVTGNHLDPSS